MATVTKPMALDESFNTTENTSRNVADVLAEGLDNIAESILPKAATEIPIESGSATNTKDYIDSKVASDYALSSNPVDVNGTYQIPTAVFNHSLIVIGFRRYGYYANYIIAKRTITDRTAITGSTRATVSNTMFWDSKIDNNGLITITAKGDTTVPFIEVIGFM